MTISILPFVVSVSQGHRNVNRYKLNIQVIVKFLIWKIMKVNYNIYKYLIFVRIDYKVKFEVVLSITSNGN